MEIPMTAELSSKWRLEQICEQLSIGSSTYYDRLKFLGIKASKDAEGVYLNAEQMKLMEDLSEHIKATGKMQGFGGGGQLAVAENSSALEIPTQQEEFDVEGDGGAFEALMREAAELKVQQEAMPDLVRLHLAAQMRVEDLPEDLRAKLQAVKEAADPSSPKQNPAAVASNLLDKYRAKRSGN